MNAPGGVTATQAASPLDVVTTTIVEATGRPKRRSQWELVRLVEERCGVKSRWRIRQALEELGANAEGWWPARVNMPVRAVEFEAEALALLVTARIGLAGSRAEYLRRYFDGDVVPDGVSLDHIAKAEGLLERMAQQMLPSRPVKKPRGARR